ncbi:zinc ribbon domain-containing protein [Halorhabdus tiamatea]|uniref:zinc ribbon domain-containing protein n=1 Tax=Halorhabdus tiamatea TaxID=430914 RepID=UPI0011D21C7D|nr:zinc ribbon domain-containing protein [Halorhabdus tiamatea]
MTTEEDKSFTDSVEEVPTANYEEDQSQKDSDNSDGALVGGLGLLLVVVSWFFFAQGQVVIAVFFLVLAFVILIVFKPEDATPFKDISEGLEQAQSSSKPNQKKICQNCGWQNPKDNNYCHDCGEELNP